MGEVLVGSMVAALRRANRSGAGGSPAAEPQAAPRSPGAWGYLAHPGLMPTVFCPSDEGDGADAGEEVTERKV